MSVKLVYSAKAFEQNWVTLTEVSKIKITLNKNEFI